MKAQVFRKASDWLRFRDSELTTQNLGFVPTMGALHPGHASLIRQSAAENERTLLSIFVNPTQFNDPKDLQNYPRTWEQDLALAEKSGADFVLYPEADEIYSDQYRYQVQEKEFSRILCGAHRPGHFDGVLTVVLKLLNLAGARRAYFGEKDFQQLELIRGMARAFFLPVEIVGCPTVREADGLAMSSRNVRLTTEQRRVAPLIHQALSRSATVDEAREKLNEAGFRIDYLQDVGTRRLAAAHLGEVRLIDNIALGEKQS